VSTSLRVFVSKNQLEKILKEESPLFLEELLEELIVMSKFNGSSFYYFEDFFEQNKVVNNKNFKDLFLLLYEEEIDEFESFLENKAEEMEDSKNRDLLILYNKIIMEKVKELVKKIATPLYNLRLTYYLFVEGEKVSKEFISIDEAVYKTIEELVKKEKNEIYHFLKEKILKKKSKNG